MLQRRSVEWRERGNVREEVSLMDGRMVMLQRWTV